MNCGRVLFLRLLYGLRSLDDAKRKMDQFCDSLNRPFFPQYDPLTQSIVVSKAVERLPRTSGLEAQREKQREYFDNLEAAEQQQASM